MGNGASSGVGIMGDSPYTEPVEENAIRRTPCCRIVSSTLCVAMVFCSRSLAGCAVPKRTSAFAAR